MSKVFIYEQERYDRIIKDCSEQLAAIQSRINAIKKLKPIYDELATLVNPNYTPEYVQEYEDLKEVDGKWVPVAEGELIPRGKPQPQYEFSEAYKNPEQAIKLIVELAQLKLEAEGKPRIDIITMDEARKIIDSREEAYQNLADTALGKAMEVAPTA